MGMISDYETNQKLLKHGLTLITYSLFGENGTEGGFLMKKPGETEWTRLDTKFKNNKGILKFEKEILKNPDIVRVY